MINVTQVGANRVVGRSFDKTVRLQFEEELPCGLYNKYNGSWRPAVWMLHHEAGVYISAERAERPFSCQPPSLHTFATTSSASASRGGCALRRSPSSVVKSTTPTTRGERERVRTASSGTATRPTSTRRSASRRGRARAHARWLAALSTQPR
ncbi:hypothetical protein NFJ02_19g32300 [Pycnococcus provasolii]